MQPLLLISVLFTASLAHAETDLTLRGWEMEIEALHYQCMHDELEACIELNYRFKVLELQERYGDDPENMPA